MSSLRLGQVEATLAFLVRSLELGHHHLLGRVVGHLQVIGTCHHRRQIVVSLQRCLKGLAHNCECRMKILESSNREFWATGDELQELAPLLLFKLTHGTQQVLECATLASESVVRLDSVHECLIRPVLVTGTEKSDQLLRTETCEILNRKKHS